MSTATSSPYIPGIRHHTARVNGTTIHYVSAGAAGSPILLVHGFPETWWAFHKLIPMLAKNHRMHPGLRRDATAYLVGWGVRTIGIDAWGLDRAFDAMAGEVLRGEEGVEFWETHLYGLEGEYAQIEKLSNLDALPVSHGFTLMAFPYKIRGASAGWSRVVALVEMEG